MDWIFTRLALLAFTILSGTGQAQECHHTATTFSCVSFLKNYDADTITVNIPNVHPLIGNKISVRVAGIDAPEIKGSLPCEKEASRNAKRLVENVLSKARRIDLINVEKDKYFRILADVMVDGRNLKEVLLKNRLAYQYDGGTKEKRNWCNLDRGVASKLNLPD